MARLDLQIHIRLVMAPRSMALAEPRRASLLLLSQTVMAAKISRSRQYHWVGA